MRTGLKLFLSIAVVLNGGKASLSTGQQAPFNASRTSKSAALLLDLAHAGTAAEPGCNSTAFTQVPGESTLFIGRQQITAGGGLAGFSAPNDCSGGNPDNERSGEPYNRWGLVLDSFNWQTKQFKLAKPLLDTSLNPETRRSGAIVTGGPMRGLIIRSAYDPSAVKFHGVIFVAFECTLENGVRYGVEETSSCLTVYDPVRRSIDMSRTVVAVSGARHGNVYQVASVPRLLVFGGKLYLYWAASIITDGKIVRSDARGAELQLADGIPTVRAGPKRVLKPTDASSTVVWSVGRSSSTNLIANIMSFLPLRHSFFALAVLGGADCQNPAGTSPGCFRLAVSRSKAPLSTLGFGRAQQQHGLPTNPNEYPTLIVDPKGNWWLLGHFRRPLVNGYAERSPAPGPDFWRSSPRESAVVLIPAKLPND